MDKKHLQLGMNPSTASGRLVKDILFSLIVETKKNICFHCQKEINREDFSIEHKIPWLDSENPIKLFFDLENISFSHLKCNVANARKNKLPCGNYVSYVRGCRCALCKEANALKQRKAYTSENRKIRYQRTGH